MSEKARIRAEARRLMAYFEASGAQPVEADILLPAETLLDLYGEDIRARAYVTHDALRGEMMLRPDFTVPVVQMHMRAGAPTARYTYMGEVFRQQERDPSRAPEYLQVGYELFDSAAPAQADAEVFALFQEVLSPLGLRATTGDMGVMTAAIEGLKTSAARKSALMRHVWRPQRFRALLERYSGQAPVPAARAALLTRLQAGEDVLAGAGPMIGLRGADEIRARLKALTEDAATPPLCASEVAVLDKIMSLRAKAPRALDQLGDLLGDLPALAPAISRLEARISALADQGVDVEGLDFEGSYGRSTMEYYDGFVFGFHAPHRPDLPAVATGGRYDALTRVLGRGQACPAVGGVIRPELLHSLKAEARP